MLNARALHVQRRSVPPSEYHQRGIRVRVVQMPARGTNEARLALATALVHGSTDRACLRTEDGIDLDKVEGLIMQHGLNLEPSDVQNGAVKAALLSNVLSRLFERTLRAFAHIGGAKALNHNGSIAARNIGRCPVRPIFPDASLPGFETRSAFQCLGVALRATLAPTASLLSALVERLDGGYGLRKRNHLAIAQGKRRGNATVDAYGGTNVRDIPVNQAPNADLPSKSGTGNGSLSNVALNGTGATELHPADFGELHAAPLGIQLLDCDFTTNEAKGIVHAFALHLRKASATGEEVPERGIKVLQNALLRCLAYLTHKIELCTKVFKLPSLRNVIEVVARTGLVLPPPRFALFERKVPDKTTDTSVLSELLLLWCGRLKPVCKTPENHIKLIVFFPSDVNSQVRFLPILKGGVSSAESFG